MEAGTRVLVERGYEGASTNRIAAEAGISPGSLYQYFPDKDAIVAEIAARYSRDLEALILARLQADLDSPLPVLVEGLFAATLDALSQQPEILRAVMQTAPRDGLAGITLRQRFADTGRAYLRFREDVLRDLPTETAVWIVVEVGIQLTIRYVLDEPDVPRDELIRELTDLVTRYLTAPAAE